MNKKKFFRTLYPFGYPNEKIYFLYSIGNMLYHKKFVRLSIFIEYLILRKFSCAISSQASIHNTVTFPHPIGIVIGAGVKIEKNVIIYQNVTVGRRDANDPKYPIIKKNSIIYSNAVIIGNGIIEENTIVGANTAINFSTEKSSVYVGAKARRIR